MQETGEDQSSKKGRETSENKVEPSGGAWKKRTEGTLWRDKEATQTIGVRGTESRKEERKKCHAAFVWNPYKFAKSLFEESKSRKLNCSKEDLEKHLKETYTNAKRNEWLPRMTGLKKPSAPGVEFNMGDIRMKEVDEFVKKAWAKSAPGNDGVC